MFWDSIFAINTAQGLFLITVLFIKRKNNPKASLFLACMVFLMVITNSGYLVIRTSLLYSIPYVYLFSFGTIFLAGPLFYFYVKSITDSSFRLGKFGILHFLPYIVQTLAYLPYYFADKKIIISFINNFLSGNLPVTIFSLVIFTIQIMHFTVYIYFSSKLVSNIKTSGSALLIVPLEIRYKWLKNLLMLFILHVFVLFALYIFIIVTWKYDPLSNFIYTFISTSIIYFISYTLILKPEPVNPGFLEKYSSYRSIESSETEKLLAQLKKLIEIDKIYTDPELKLSKLATKIGTTPHQLSRIINEKFGKSYNDYINEFRIGEFILLLNDPGYTNLSIYGLALECGFNSKSSFNFAFKKLKGMNPSDFRKNHK